MPVASRSDVMRSSPSLGWLSGGEVVGPVVAREPGPAGSSDGADADEI